MLLHTRLLACAFGLAILCTSAMASDVTVSCRSKAAAAADQWADGRIIPASDAASEAPNRLVVISYGHKYTVARDALVDADRHLQPLGTLAIERNIVYSEELDRCLGRFTVRVVHHEPQQFYADHPVIIYPFAW
jgi:hypothetical protein